MSVTTNTFGLVDGFYEQLTKEKFSHLVTHYPPNKSDPLLNTTYHDFIYRNCHPNQKRELNVIFGNGASEVIDLAIRMIPSGAWKTNDVMTQYREYRNTCYRTNRQQLNPTDPSAILTVVINPNNPTGDFMTWDKMKDYIDKHVANDSYLIVDESMLFWYGADWLQHSLLGHVDEINNLQIERNIKTLVVQSWTKFFSSTGLRIGSLVCFDDQLYNSIKNEQPPWSMNAIGREYLLWSFNKPEYCEKTWTSTPIWRSEIVAKIKQICPYWTITGADFLSWIWIDTHNQYIAEYITSESKAMGFPIRHGKYGYELDTFIRIAVRDPVLIGEWFNILERINNRRDTLGIFSIEKIKKELILCEKSIPISKIIIHEEFIKERADSLYDYCITSNFTASIPSIIVTQLDDGNYFLIDGHHRLAVFVRLNYINIPITVVDYDNDAILVNPPYLNNPITKYDLKNIIHENKILQPKTTQHVVHCTDRGCDRYIPIALIANQMSF